MSSFIVNGKVVCTDKETKLLHFLRDELRLTSVKNGCEEGACGTCLFLIDGVATKACVTTTGKVDGKTIVTLEGLTEREKSVYSYAFAKCGAVQCGFCTPGMIISAKALLDKNLQHEKNQISDEQIKTAIKGNICRCTGYIKIVEAIKLAAKIFRENEEIPSENFTGRIGENIPRVDAVKKALGEAFYTDDLFFDGMLYGGVVHPPYPRIYIKKINTEKAESLSGVHAVITAKDLPAAKKIGHLKKDWDVLIGEGEVTRYIGDGIVLIAAETKEILEQAKKLIEIEYNVLPVINSPKDALHKSAPLLHEDGNVLFVQKLRRGNPEDVIKNSKYVVTKRYSTPFTEHAFLEPECAVSVPKSDGGIVIYCSDQSAFQTQHECVEVLGLPTEKVHVKTMTVGGGFGGKEDMSVQHYSALLAQKTGKPVKFKLSRQESINVHPKRHAMEMEFTTACDENGILTAMKATIISDTGAYASLGGPVLQRACTHAPGPYNYHDIEIVGKAVYTNNPPAGAFRGFGVTQSLFATECNLNLLAEMVGISPWEIRMRNAIRPGQTLPNGQIADSSTALVQCLEAVKDAFYQNKFAGIACGIKNSGLGVGVPDVGRCKIKVEGGKVHVLSGAACIGQGLQTVLLQITCEATGLSPKDIIIHDPDTEKTPNSGVTTASRQTLFTGEATRFAAQKLALDLVEKSLSSLEGNEYFGEYAPKTDKIGTEKENPVSHVAYGYAAQVAILDDSGNLVKIVAAHDVGQPINPVSVEGQIEGGVVMSAGYALTENFPLKDGVPQAKFGTLGLLRADKAPTVETILVKGNVSEEAFGAKGVGEIASIPTAPAIQGAYYSFDGIFRTKLPLQIKKTEKKNELQLWKLKK